VKARQLKRKEKEALNKQKTENKIDTKDYLTRKKEIEEALALYDHALQGTIFEHW
jgi:hypothetical protein